MRYVLFLFSVLALLAGQLRAQTAPVAPAAPAKAEKSPWLIFDQPLDSLPGSRRQARREQPPQREQPERATPPPASSSTNQVEATQGATYVPLDPNTYRLLDRYAIRFGPDREGDPHTSVRPYTRAAAARLGGRMSYADGDSAAAYGRDAALRAGFSAADKFNAAYLLRDNWVNANVKVRDGHGLSSVGDYFRGVGSTADVYYHVSSDFMLRVNPVLLLQAGKDNLNTDGLRYVNTRGVQAEGTIDQRLGFYAFLTDNQEAVPQYVQNRIVRDTIVPHEGFWKPYKNTPGQYDFFSARGYVTYAATKHINVQLGHDRNFIGNGYRSLILSDYSTPYFFLKLNTRVWKLNYQNLFAELTARKENSDQVYPKKYLALHHLSLDVTPNFNVGLFESTIAGNSSNRLELQYFNPLIFYRAIEQQVGSADNAILGLDFKWNVRHTAQLYGQLVLDEFKLSEVRAGNGWWANKQAVQVGAKYLDVAGLRNLDLQVELNYIRPYTYQHETFYTAYTHYDQPLAHPMGANLTEVLGVLSYQPLPRLNLVGKTFYTEQGLDYTFAPNGQPINYGGNPLLPYVPHPMDFGNRVGQGDKRRLLHLDFTATYQPRLNLFLDATLISRSNRSTIFSSSGYTETYASLALRWNIAQRLHEF